MVKHYTCDIDGVLSDFNGYFAKFLKKEIPELPPPIEAVYHFTKRYPAQFAERLNEAWAKFQELDLFIELEALPGIQRVNALEPVIVTARPQSARASTIAWLSANGIEYSGLVLKSDDSKASEANPNTVLAHFEDMPKYIFEFTRVGIPVYKFTHPYNRNIRGRNIIPVSGWSEVPVEELVKKINAPAIN